jgi:nitrite reductase (NADH) small subunit
MALVTLCTAADLPAPGQMREFQAAGKSLCLANEAGVYAAIDNICPHRGGPLAEGMLEAGKVLCPWHAWAFDLKTGEADHDPTSRVAVYALHIEGEQVLADL